MLIYFLFIYCYIFKTYQTKIIYGQYDCTTKKFKSLNVAGLELAPIGKHLSAATTKTIRYVP